MPAPLKGTGGGTADIPACGSPYAPLEAIPDRCIVFVVLTPVMRFKRIDPGHVGIAVDLYGGNKRVQAIPVVTGMDFYSPLMTGIFSHERGVPGRGA